MLGRVSPFHSFGFCFSFGMIPRCSYDGLGLLLRLLDVAMAFRHGREGRQKEVCTVCEISPGERASECECVYICNEADGFDFYQPGSIIECQVRNMKVVRLRIPNHGLANHKVLGRISQT